MATTLFDEKIFNGEAFQRYMRNIPNLVRNELIKAGVIRENPALRNFLRDQAGGNMITEPMYGLIGGDSQNYDGQTTITPTSTDTYKQTKVVKGYAKAWLEKDFSADITGSDPIGNVARQVALFWQTEEQKTLLNILQGVFATTDTNSAAFVTAHTTDISGVGDGKITVTTLNTATQAAAGDNKNIFGVAIMHSAVATNLENLNLLEYLKYTDANGVQRNLNMATWNGRLVLIDDAMPFDSVAGAYTTYLLGAGAFEYCDVGALYPAEMHRERLTNGGQSVLTTRQRKLYAPRGFDWTSASMATESPTMAELANGANWKLVNNNQAGATNAVINHRAIPIARIISLG